MCPALVETEGEEGQTSPPRAPRGYASSWPRFWSRGRVAADTLRTLEIEAPLLRGHRPDSFPGKVFSSAEDCAKLTFWRRPALKQSRRYRLPKVMSRDSVGVREIPRRGSKRFRNAEQSGEKGQTWRGGKKLRRGSSGHRRIGRSVAEVADFSPSSEVTRNGVQSTAPKDSLPIRNVTARPSRQPGSQWSVDRYEVDDRADSEGGDGDVCAQSTSKKGDLRKWRSRLHWRGRHSWPPLSFSFPHGDRQPIFVEYILFISNERASLKTA